LATLTGLKYLYFAYFSKPATDRALYRLVRRLRPRRIVEIGLVSPQRTTRMIRLARGYLSDGQFRYAAIDRFEDRADGGGLSLKQAYRALRRTRARIQLIPGDPLSALARTANVLSNVDLLLVAADHDPQLLAQAWFYVPRMLHRQSQVVVELPTADGAGKLRLLERKEVDRRASVARRRRAA
jgi:predicted O-methyltransferase YrrM